MKRKETPRVRARDAQGQGKQDVIEPKTLGATSREV